MPSSIKRRVPVAGVRWGEGELVPPDSLRRCRICRQPIEHLDIKRVCCNHPRCKRANRIMPPAMRARVKAIESITPDQLKAVEAKKRYAYARLKGATPVQGYEVVARRMNMRVADVIAIVEPKK